MNNTDTKSVLLKPFTLRGLPLDGNIFLAPMAGWTDTAFRSICLRWGAFCTFTEMISAEAIIRANAKTIRLLRRADNEKYLGVQIFTSTARSAALAVRQLSSFKPSLFDLNCGCSIPKILKSGAGAALMRNTDLIRDIVRAMCDETAAPVSVKLRSGWDINTLNYREAADRAVAGGAAMISIHPRTRTQLFSGKANWEQIRILKSNLDVPVIGSGDLFTAGDVRDMLAKTRCDGVMLGRGALGNPFIFQDIRGLLLDGYVKEKITPEIRLKTALQQLRLSIRDKESEIACREMRKHFCAYSKGLEGSASFRAKIVRASNYVEYEKITNRFLEEYERNQT